MSVSVYNKISRGNYCFAVANVILLLFVLPVLCLSNDGDFAKRHNVVPSPAGAQRFVTIQPGQSGILFTNRLAGLEFYKNMVAHNGAGVAVGDVNGDNMADVYLCNIQGANALYLNQGDFHFKSEPQAAPLQDKMSTGAAIADVDNDGDNDLLVNGIQSGTRLFLNDSRGHFELNENSGLDSSGTTSSLALADIDGDGDLDLYVAHYIDRMYLADPTTRFDYSRKGDQWGVTRINGESALKPRWKDRFTVSNSGRVRELPEADRIYLNNGDGTFRDVSTESMFVVEREVRSLASLREWGLAVTFRDVNNDLLPDIYVCNDFPNPDRFWINQGNSQFKLASHLNIRHTSRSSMGVDFTDLNADGVPDFMLMDMLDPGRARRLVQLDKEVDRSSRLLDWTYVPRFNRNVLMVSQGWQQWFDTAYYSGVEASAWSWNVRFLDADLDGDDDIIVTNGFSFDTMDMDGSLQLKEARKVESRDARSLYETRRLQPLYNSPNKLFRNDGGLMFQESGEEFGFAHDGITYGLGVADFDNDGDLDFITNNLNEAPSLYCNTAQEPRILVRLVGGVGSKVYLHHAGGKTVREKVSGGGYLSDDNGDMVFAANTLGPQGVLEVEWRDGSKSTRIERPKLNSIYRVEKQEAVKRVAKHEVSLVKPMFERLVDAISFRHFPRLEKDFDENPFLLRRLSATAPPMLCRDFDGNGWMDVGFQLARNRGVQVFLNQNGRRFKSVASEYNDSGDLMPNAGWISGLMINDGQPTFDGVLNRVIPELKTDQQVRLLLRADINGDSSVDVVMFTQSSLSQHPASSRAIVLLQRAGVFQRSSVWEKSFGELGQVASAVCLDMDGDHDADLLVSREVGSIALFENRGDRFVDVSRSSGLSRFVGLWQGLVVGDFDNDGRIDFAAGNLGRNSSLEPYRKELVHLSRSGEMRLSLFALKREGVLLPIDDMDLFARVVDRSKLPQRYRDFSDTDLTAVLDSFGSIQQRKINCFETSVFLNRGNIFERLELPSVAQWSPTSSINVADFDVDGREDLFLSQNWYSIRPDLGRLDSSAGVILLGQGDGTFKPVTPARSGLAVLGESRNAVVTDFDRDGRSDIMATQTLGQAQLYLGQSRNRGIRINFIDNGIQAKYIGCSVRLIYPNGTGSPRRWFHSGDGVLAQCVLEQVLGFEEWPVSIQCEWSNGTKQTIPVGPEKYDYMLP